MKNISVLGSTGSIGINALKVISGLAKDEFQVAALSGNSNIELLAEQTRKFRPKAVCVVDLKKIKEFKKIANLRGTRLYEGEQGLQRMAAAKDIDLVVMAITGSASLLPLIKAIDSGKTIALASKEPLVSAGRIIIDRAKKNGVRLIPVDSEHSAIFQCLAGRKNGELKKIYLTGTGGPLRNISARLFNKFSPAKVVKHPTWKMGKKISVDSATLMNKGLEVIEARWLFDVGIDDIEVLIHPEALVHSMVELRDGTILAQLAAADMRLPIQYALTYPQRQDKNRYNLDFKKIRTLTFRPPDRKKFPCLQIAYEAAKKDQTYPAVLNAANEIAVDSYLNRTLKFTLIPEIVEKVLAAHKPVSRPKLEDILATDLWAREEAKNLIAGGI